MNTKTLFASAIALILGIPFTAIATPPRQAPCKLEQRIAPASQLQTISNDRFSFQIPQNYSATTEQTSITIHNPTQSKFLACAKQYRMLDAASAIPPLWIEVHPIADSLLPADRGEYSRKPINIAGTSGIIAKARVPSGYPDEGDTHITVAVTNGDRNRIFIRYSTPESPLNSIDSGVFTQIVNSLKLK
jgi:hypothetical protein